MADPFHIKRGPSPLGQSPNLLPHNICMSYGRHLKGDRIIPSDDFRQRSCDVPVASVPPLLNPKRLSRMPMTLPKQEKRYSVVPEPTSLDVNKRAISMMAPKPEIESKLSKLAKRVSSLQDSIFQQRRDMTPLESPVMIPKITLGDLATEVPFVEKLNPEHIQFQSPNIIKRLTHRFKPASPVSEFDVSIASQAFEEKCMDSFSDTENDNDISSDIVDMNRRVFVNEDHLSLNLESSSTVNLPSSATSILSSVLNCYSDLNQDDGSIKITRTTLEPIHVQLPYSIHTPTHSRKSGSIFSAAQITPSSNSEFQADDVDNVLDDAISVTDQSKLPMEVYNVKMVRTPIDQFQIRQYSPESERAVVFDQSLPPPTPAHHFNVSPSTTYYTCKSSSIKSSNSSVYSNKIPLDYTELKAIPYSEKIKIPQDTDIFTRQPHVRSQSILSKEYLKMAQIDPSLLGGPDQDVKLAVVNI